MRVFVIAVLAAIVPMGVGAQTLYTTGSPQDGLGDAWGISPANQAMDFTLPSNSIVTGAHIWTTFQGTLAEVPGDGFAGYFDWTIFTTDPATSLPGIAIASGRVVPTLTSQALGTFGDIAIDESEWDIPMTPTQLMRGTTYWLSLHNTDANGDYVSGDFYWDGSVDPPNTDPSASQYYGMGPWISNSPIDADYYGYGNRLAMTLYGTTITTPEPSPLALLGTGVMGLAPVVLLKRKS